jgi:hypothetical protein
LFHPWAEAGLLKRPRSRWTGIPRYPEHRQGKILVWISPLLHPNTKRQREGRVATVNFDQMRGKGVGLVKEVVWWSF